jgi:hypothetical protein
MKVAGTGAGGNAGSEGDGQPNQFIFRIVAGDGPDQPEGAFRFEILSPISSYRTLGILNLKNSLEHSRLCLGTEWP